jgi:hypothetical protein
VAIRFRGFRSTARSFRPERDSPVGQRWFVAFLESLLFANYHSKQNPDAGSERRETVNPRQFLLIGGAVLVLVGILGFVGVIGPTAQDSIFGEPWWFDNGENWAHTILGVVAIIAGVALPSGAQRGLVILVGLVGIFFGVYNLFSTTFLGTNLENPADTLLHFAVGAWALLSSLGGRQRAMA